MKQETLPDSWTSRPLGQCGEWISGGTPSKSRPEYWNGEIPWFSAKSLKSFDLVDAEDRVTELGAKDGTTIVPPGTILFVVRGMSLANEFRVGITTRRATLNQDLRGIIAAEDVDPRYLARFMRQSPDVIGQVDNASHGTKRIETERLKAVRVHLPALAEQKRIADILDKADAIRRKRREANDTAATIRVSLFHEFFDDANGCRDDWPLTSMDDAAIIDAPMVDPRNNQYSHLLHIGPDRIEKDTGRLLPALTASAEGLISGKFLFDDRYVLYSKIRPYLRKVALPDFTGLCSADVYPVRPVPAKATREFLFAILISDAFLAYTQSLPSRASIPKLNRAELGAFTFRLPPLELQERYSRAVQKHDRQARTREKAEDQTIVLFNSLVQRAFLGEL